MALLVLRFTLVPCTVLLASVLQRRLGPAVGGRVVGLPLTTGPFLLLLCLDAGPVTAARAAAGVIAGQLSVVGFCLAYGHLALGPTVTRRRPWLALAGALAAVATAAVVAAAVHPPWLLALATLAAIAVGLMTWPSAPAAGRPGRTARAWETPLRMAVSGALVATLLGTASLLGARLAGLLATMPVILTVLCPATHRADGPAAAAEVARGALASMAASIAFVTVLAYTLGSLPTAAAVALALGALLVTDHFTAPAASGLGS